MYSSGTLCMMVSRHQYSPCGPSAEVIIPASEASCPLGKKCLPLPRHVVSGVFRSNKNSFFAMFWFHPFFIILLNLYVYILRIQYIYLYIMR